MKNFCAVPISRSTSAKSTATIRSNARSASPLRRQGSLSTLALEGERQADKRGSGKSGRLVGGKGVRGVHHFVQRWRSLYLPADITFTAHVHACMPARTPARPRVHLCVHLYPPHCSPCVDFTDPRVGKLAMVEKCDNPDDTTNITPISSLLRVRSTGRAVPILRRSLNQASLNSLRLALALAVGAQVVHPVAPLAGATRAVR